jgi:hypothetical protein
LTLVDDLTIGSAAECVDRERERAAAIVEGVEHEDDNVVARPDIAVVAAHLGRDETIHLRVPHAERHVDVVGIVGEPQIGALAGDGAVVGLDLNEAGDRRDARVERFVEGAVNAQWRVHAHGADCRRAVAFARHDSEGFFFRDDRMRAEHDRDRTHTEESHRAPVSPVQGTGDRNNGVHRTHRSRSKHDVRVRHDSYQLRASVTVPTQLLPAIVE